MTALMRRPLLVALAVDLLRAREQRLDTAEVDEDVVAIAGLLDDAGHDLALAVDVLLVHDRALGLADSLLDHLLRRLRGDASEVVGRHVRALDLLRRNLRPVELEVLVRDERVLALARLLLELLELGDARLARLLDEPDLDVLRDLDPEDAELAHVVELDLGVAGRARCLLVRGTQRVLECGDEHAFLDALLLLDRLNALDDLLAHVRQPLVDQIGPHDGVVRDADLAGVAGVERDGVVSGLDQQAAMSVLPAAFEAYDDFASPTASAKCSGLRSGRSGPGDETSIV